MVQFTNTGSADDALTQSELEAGISEVNEIFAPAGVQFYIRDKHEVVDSPFTHTRHDVIYAWDGGQPQPNVFNTGCSLTYSPTPEDEAYTLMRTGTYCAADGELVLFLVETLKDATTANPPYGCGSGGCPFNWGAFPWEGNAVILMRTAFNASVRNVISHEFGHYLGLPHSFQGASSGYDLTTANSRNFEDGGQALSLYWDLVYVPGAISNAFFNSQSEAAAYEAYLLPIQYQSDEGVMCGPTATTDCPSGSDGKLFLTVENAVSGSESYHTGQTPLKGLGFNLPYVSGQPTMGINVMSYNYNFATGSGPASGNEIRRHALSVSQIEQIKKALKHDVASTMFPGTTGRRNLLGLGAGSWGSWESLGGGTTDDPAVAARLGTADRIDLVVRGTGGGVYNKVLQSGGWWPSQSGWNNISGTIVGSPALGVRSNGDLDLVVKGTNNTVYHQRWTGSWPGWSQVGSLTTATGEVRIAERSNGNTDAVVMASDGNAYVSVWTSSWSSWSSVGAVAETPDICDDASGNAHILRRRTDNSGEHLSYSGGSPGSWATNLGGTLAEAPVATSWGSGRLDVVALMSGGTIANKVLESSTWWPSNGWNSLGGNMAGRPSITTWGSNRLDVVARGSDGAIRYKYWTSSGGWWPADDWAVLGGSAASNPVIVTWGTNRLDVFVRGTNGEIWHRARTQ